MSNNRNKEESFYDDKEEYRRSLRLIDDDFMTLFFNNFNEGAQLLLDIILDRKDIKVKSVHTQEIMKSLTGRDVWLDILATDEEGNKYNIEIQRAAPGADRRRARYHSSMIDSSMMPPNSDFSDLGENYVIFITEHDILACENRYTISIDILKNQVNRSTMVSISSMSTPQCVITTQNSANS